MTDTKSLVFRFEGMEYPLTIPSDDFFYDVTKDGGGANFYPLPQGYTFVNPDGTNYTFPHSGDDGWFQYDYFGPLPTDENKHIVSYASGSLWVLNAERKIYIHFTSNVPDNAYFGWYKKVPGVYRKKYLFGEYDGTGIRLGIQKQGYATNDTIRTTYEIKCGIHDVEVTPVDFYAAPVYVGTISGSVWTCLGMSTGSGYAVKPKVSNILTSESQQTISFVNSSGYSYPTVLNHRAPIFLNSSNSQFSNSATNISGCDRIFSNYFPIEYNTNTKKLTFGEVEWDDETLIQQVFRAHTDLIHLGDLKGFYGEGQLNSYDSTDMNAAHRLEFGAFEDSQEVQTAPLIRFSSGTKPAGGGVTEDNFLVFPETYAISGSVQVSTGYPTVQTNLLLDAEYILSHNYQSIAATYPYLMTLSNNSITDTEPFVYTQAKKRDWLRHDDLVCVSGGGTYSFQPIDFQIFSKKWYPFSWGATEPISGKTLAYNYFRQPHGDYSIDLFCETYQARKVSPNTELVTAPPVPLLVFFDDLGAIIATYTPTEIVNWTDDMGDAYPDPIHRRYKLTVNSAMIQAVYPKWNKYCAMYLRGAWKKTTYSTFNNLPTTTYTKVDDVTFGNSGLTVTGQVTQYPFKTLHYPWDVYNISDGKYIPGKMAVSLMEDQVASFANLAFTMTAGATTATKLSATSNSFGVKLTNTRKYSLAPSALEDFSIDDGTFTTEPASLHIWQVQLYTDTDLAYDPLITTWRYKGYATPITLVSSVESGNHYITISNTFPKTAKKVYLRVRYAHKYFPKKYGYSLGQAFAGPVNDYLDRHLYRHSETDLFEWDVDSQTINKIL
jgi:hypothetical protein